MSLEKHEVLLSVKDVNLSFDEKQILKDINFEVRDIVNTSFVGQGQVIALLAKSGVGKTCLLNILAGLLRPNTGKILVNVDQRPVKAGDMGVVFQDYYFYSWMTIKKVLELSAKKNKNISKGDIENSVKLIAEQFDLTPHLQKYSYQLSGGQRQRVAIAEQILNGGNFILLDEPFSGLDVIVIDKVMETLLKVATSDELKTLIIVSHDLPNTISISDTIFVLNKTEEGKGPATIVKEIDLIERGLAYHSNVKEMPEFLSTLAEVKELMR
jgi:polar amino acid transport system ATP-binding protein/sulfate transport system ATP-binding protein/NitT/TauT family transport system ATP-binding protein